MTEAKKPLLKETAENAAKALQGYFKLLIQRRIFSESLSFSAYNEKWLEGVLKNLRVAGIQAEAAKIKDLIKVNFKF